MLRCDLIAYCCCVAGDGLNVIGMAVNCEGHFSDCDEFCEKRYTVTLPAQAAGVPCPFEDGFKPSPGSRFGDIVLPGHPEGCKPGEGSCPHNGTQIRRSDA